MRIITFLLTVALAIGIQAAAMPSPFGFDVGGIPNVDLAPDNYNGTAGAGENVEGVAGLYKFLDGTEQDLHLGGLFCNYMTYETGDWKGYLGHFNGARVNKGIMCYFYSEPCDPDLGYAEPWIGWWEVPLIPGTKDGFAYAPQHKFKAYYCRNN